MLNRNKIGFTLGLFLAIVHAFWAILIGIIPNPLQSFLDRMFNLHMLVPIWKITAFNIGNAIMLVITTFIAGYIFGWVFAWCHNMMHKK